MLTWPQFASEQPKLAGASRALLYEVGVGLGYLATVTADGGPRVHPVCPVINDDGMFVFVVPSPKQRDLHRDGRFALHSFPREDDEDACYLTGRARHVDDAAAHARLGRRFADERQKLAVPAPGHEQHLFELLLATVMVTRTTGHGDPAPQHTVWHAP